jgi:hypothetical protein
MLFTDEGEGGAVQVTPAPAAEPTVAEASRRRSSKATSSPPIFHPLAYRGVVADWPDEWREQWGRRANALEDSGLSWRDAETQAFVEVWKLRRREQPEEFRADVDATSSAERN